LSGWSLLLNNDEDIRMLAVEDIHIVAVLHTQCHKQAVEHIHTVAVVAVLCIRRQAAAGGQDTS